MYEPLFKVSISKKKKQTLMIVIFWAATFIIQQIRSPYCSLFITYPTYTLTHINSLFGHDDDDDDHTFVPHTHTCPPTYHIHFQTTTNE